MNKERYTTILDAEKIALHAAANVDRPDWQKIYKFCHPESKAKELSAIVTRWKQIPRIKEYYTKLLNDKYTQLEQAREEGRQEERRKKNEGNNETRNGATNAPEDKVIDYSDPREQKRKLNELVNTASDPKEALDALKTIIASQKDDKEAAKEKKQIQAYLPIKCKSCVLYNEALKKLTL